MLLLLTISDIYLYGVTYLNNGLMEMKSNSYNLLKMYVSSLVNESIKQVISENKVITFNGDKVYPRFGWCVILAGGAGSGKGFVIERQLPISGNVCYR